MNIYRYYRFATAPVHLRWELYPVAHEGKRSIYGGSYLEEGEWWNKPLHKNIGGELKVMLSEILFLKGIYEHNRRLWIWSFLMHQGVYWSALSVLLFLLDVILIRVGSILPAVQAVGYSAGLIGTLGLIILRLYDDKLSLSNSFATYFNLIFLLANFLSGLLSLSINPEHITEVKNFFHGLITLNQPYLSTMVFIHLL
jgi:nitrate reductase gamma subunit